MDSTVFKNSRYETFEYELLSLQGTIYSHKEDITKYVRNGSIDIDFSKNIIGGASFEINENVTNLTDINYLSDLVKIWYNISGSGLSYRIPLGVFSLTAPQKITDGKTVHRKIKAFDLLYRLDQDKTTVATNYPSGTNVIATVKAILDSVGTWVQYNIEDSSETLSEDMTYQLGRSKLYIINGLLKTINYYPIWASGNGIFRAIPWTETQTTTWDFFDNNESLYTKDISKTLDYSNTYNKVIVITNETTADTAPLTSVLTFEDLGIENDIPFSYTNIGYYKTKVFNSEAVSQSYVDLRARRELLKMLEIEESVPFNHAFITSRENDGLPYQGDCYNFKNTLLEINATYKLENMKYKLTIGGLVNSTIRRVTNVT
jgi:hypothetical protein